MDHHFDIELARKHGIEAAVILRHFQYWIIKNKANKTHLRDGRTWTYNSYPALAKIFPYFTPKIIRRVINSLVKEKILLKRQFGGQDRQLWYAFEDENAYAQMGRWITDRKTHVPKWADGFGGEKPMCPNGHFNCPYGRFKCPYGQM